MSGYAIIDLDKVRNDPAREGALVNGRLVIHPADFWAQFTQIEITTFCVLNGFYCIPTTELVAWLRDTIHGRRAIEIGSGNGVLAAALEIPATDSRIQEEPEVRDYYLSLMQQPITYGHNVRKLDALEAVRVEQPDDVIGCWITHAKRDPIRFAGGTRHGVAEEEILVTARYIFIGCRSAHRKGDKPLLQLPHEEFEFPWLVSRTTSSGNFIAIWNKLGT